MNNLIVLLQYELPYALSFIVESLDSKGDFAGTWKSRSVSVAQRIVQVQLNTP